MDAESRLVVSGMKRNWRRGEEFGDFTGGPGLKTLPFHRRGRGFKPWSGN